MYIIATPVLKADTHTVPTPALHAAAGNGTAPEASAVPVLPCAPGETGRPAPLGTAGGTHSDLPPTRPRSPASVAAAAMDPGSLAAAAEVAGLVAWRVGTPMEGFPPVVGSASGVVGEAGRQGVRSRVDVVVGRVERVAVVDGEEERIGGRVAEGNRIVRATLIPSLRGCAIENRSGPVDAAVSGCVSGTGGSSGCRRWRDCRCIAVSVGSRSGCGCDCDCDCRSVIVYSSSSSLGRIPATIRSMCSLRRCPPWPRPG